MSKKNLVKKIIDNLIQEGTDFADITQSALSECDELKGVSKTTIKRAKKEYKQEKLVNQRDFKEQNIKRKIYKYLDRRPKSSLADLREAMPSIHPSKVSEYHLFWKKKQEKFRADKTVKKNRVSPRKLKEMVFNYLDSDNAATLETLYEKFPDAKQSSINSYFAGWKRKQKNTEKAIRGGLYEVIFKFLNQKPEATIEDIKAAFSDVPVKSIEIYHNLWVKEKEEAEKKAASLDEAVLEFIETNTADRKQNKQNSRLNPEGGDLKPKRKRGRPPKAENMRHNTASIELKQGVGGRLNMESKAVQSRNSGGRQNDTYLIQTMKNTIEAHNMTIFELEKEYRLLMEQQSNIIKKLEAMPTEQITEIRDFIVTYFKGLKRA